MILQVVSKVIILGAPEVSPGSANIGLTSTYHHYYQAINIIKPLNIALFNNI